VTISDLFSSSRQGSLTKRRVGVLSLSVAAATLLGTTVLGTTVLGTTTSSAAEAALDKSITVNGQGSSFMSNFVDQCRADVKNDLGINISYSPSGSGAGRAGFIANNVDWAGSDVPFTSTEIGELKDRKFAYVPITSGGVAIAFKLKGVTSLQLSAPTVAKIFSGKIARWNDAAIAKENPKVKLPKTPVKVVVRSDSSGTSSVFTEYLTAIAAADWKGGVQKTFPVPKGNGIAQKGSDGVTNYVQGGQGEGAVTYTEVSFATERKLTVAKIINASGKAVGPDATAVQATLGASKLNADGTVTLDFATKNAAAYPISTAAYAIVPAKIDAKKAAVLKAFLNYALTGCQDKGAKLGYAPLPNNVADAGLKAVDTVGAA
jgi:phosphate transport system substrate-binding protein